MPEPIRIFASHDWGVKGINHQRVKKVVQQLAAKGFGMWFDETHMKGNIMDAMCRGIDTADVVLVFVTKNYMAKVESGNDADNVRREFMYATTKHAKMIAIRFDKELPSMWHGPVGMQLGSQLYVDLTEEGNDLDALVAMIRNVTPRVQWKAAVATVRRASLLPPPVTRQVAQMPLVVKHPPMTAATKDVPPSPAGGWRDRANRIAAVMGGTEAADKGHIGPVIHALFVSILGSHDAGVPFHAKVERLERELGM